MAGKRSVVFNVFYWQGTADIPSLQNMTQVVATSKAEAREIWETNNPELLDLFTSVERQTLYNQRETEDALRQLLGLSTDETQKELLFLLRSINSRTLDESK